MPRPHSLLLCLGLVAALAGCQLQGPGTGQSPEDVTPNAVAGDAIEVTALDPDQPAEAAAAAQPGGEPTAQPQSDPREPADESPADKPDPAPQPDLGVTDPEAEGEGEGEVAPEPPKSEKQLACEKKKGNWVATGGPAFTCIFATKDAGESCTRSTQCEGECLARSGTCSPVKPLLGCNEVLQDNGARVTLCVE